MNRSVLIIPLLAACALAQDQKPAASSTLADMKYQFKVGVLPFVDNTGSGGDNAPTELGRANGAHLVLASTALFGTPKRLPVREDDATEPNNPYALSKFLAERACAFYAAKFSVPDVAW